MADTEGGSGLKGWPLVLSVYVYGLLSISTVGKMFPLVAPIAADLHAQSTVISWLVTSVALIATLASPIAGKLVDRFGARRVMALACACGLLGNVGAYVSGSFGALLAARLLEGGAFALLVVCGTTLIARSTSGVMQARAMAFWVTSGPVGIGLSQSLSGAAAGSGWRIVFLCSAVLFAVGLAFTQLLPADRPQVATAVKRGIYASARNLPLLRLCSCAGLLVVTSIGTASVFPSFMHDRHGMTLGQASLLGGMASLASIAGNLLAGATLSKGISPSKLPLISLPLLAGFGALAFVTGLSASAVAVALVIANAGLGLTTGVNAAMLPRLVGDPAAMGGGSGLYYQFANFGMLVAAPIAFIAYGGWNATGIVVEQLVLLVVLLVLTPRRWYR